MGKRMMRTAFGIMLLCCLFPSVGKAAAEKPEDRMLNDLLAYVYQSEMMYTDMEWILEAFDRFEEERSWESLQLARATLFIGKRDVAACALPKVEMTVNDHMELMARGIDVSFLAEAGTDFLKDQEMLLNTCYNLHYSIMDEMFLEEDWKICVNHVRVQADLLENYFQYLANTADWVLATLGDDAVTAAFNSLLAEHCPRTHSYQAEVLPSPSDIEAVTGSLLDEMEDLLLENAKIVGAKENRLNQIRYSLETDDPVEIYDDVLQISGMPLLLFYPEWFSDENVYYFWTEDGEMTNLPPARTTLDRIPDGCRIRVEGVTLEELLKYQEQLEAAGMPCVGSTGGEAERLTLYECGSSVFAFQWEKNTVTVYMTENPVCFVPYWYLNESRGQRP